MVTRLFFNIILAFAWCLLQDEISLRQFVIGFLVGLSAMLFFPRSFHQERRYFRKVTLSVQLVFFFVKELLIANWTVVRQVLAPELKIQSGIVAYPLSLQNDVLITLLANMITLTPGTLSVEVAPDRQFLFIHFLDVDDVEEEIRIIKDGFERYLLLIAQ
ncbi:MAG: Na+/H+ antiporter subunit E [Desulfurellaceae bacterium]|nr:Na+/H+ antiporter subunit E [Desulfurellaceae bacterium]